MTEYQPTSRRPIAEMFRATAHLAVRLCLRLNIHPDAVSYASMVAAALAGAAFYFSKSSHGLLLVAPLFCYVRLWMNMLDGMVALASGKASPRGEILNDLPDRISDILIFAGVAHSGWGNPFLAYWAMIGALLTAYVGMFGQAVKVHREFSGIMSKPWRMVVLHLGAWFLLAMLWWKPESIQPGNLNILDWACIVVIVGCVQTVWVRLARIMKALANRKMD